ncbi:MAG: hypothetical protein NVS1B6_17150 [Steroidobacteraceae bacterium]
MKHLALLVATAAFGFTAPTLADPGKGKGHGHGHAYDNQDDRGPGGYEVEGCPPGLRNKGCMPPGQAKKLYRGERYDSGYGTLFRYQRIPYDLRRRYQLSARNRYYYADGTIYAVDPRTMLITQVITALLH